MLNPHIRIRIRKKLKVSGNIIEEEHIFKLDEEHVEELAKKLRK